MHTARSRRPEATISPGTAARDAVTDVIEWLYGNVMQPHPSLGRRGAVCPFLEPATKAGRVSLNVVAVESRAAFERLRSVAADSLRRIVHAGDRGGRYESVLFIPVGTDHTALVGAVTWVQQELRAEAVDRGCMVGEFFPGHPAPGVHSAEFRPLQSPRPILGIRTMVDTDILFLGSPGLPAEQRQHGVEAWHRFFE